MSDKGSSSLRSHHRQQTPMPVLAKNGLPQIAVPFSGSCPCLFLSTYLISLSISISPSLPLPLSHFIPSLSSPALTLGITSSSQRREKGSILIGLSCPRDLGRSLIGASSKTLSRPMRPRSIPPYPGFSLPPLSPLPRSSSQRLGGELRRGGERYPGGGPI